MSRYFLLEKCRNFQVEVRAPVDCPFDGQEGHPLPQPASQHAHSQAALQGQSQPLTERSKHLGISLTGIFLPLPRSGSLIAFLLSESQMEAHIFAQWKSLLLDFTSHEIAVTNMLPHYRLMRQPSRKGFTSRGSTKLYHPFCHTDLIKGKYPVNTLPTMLSAHSKGKKNGIFKLYHLPVPTWQTMCRYGKIFHCLAVPSQLSLKTCFLTQYEWVLTKVPSFQIPFTIPI